MAEAHRGSHWSRDIEPAGEDLLVKIATVGSHLDSSADRDVLEDAMDEIAKLREQLADEVETLRCWNCHRKATTMRPAGGACSVCAELYDAQAYGELHARSEA